MRSLILALVLPIAGSAQQTRTLSRPAAEYAEPFTQLQGLRELRDGRLIVSDARDRTVQLIDLRGGAAVAVGRQGAGPAEWGSAGRLVAFPGDTTVLLDGTNARMLLIAPDGKPARIFSPAAQQSQHAPAGAAGGGHGTTAFGGGMGPVAARTTDAQGRFYYQGPSVSLEGHHELAQSDSAPILRYTPGSGALDTVAFVNLAPEGRPAQSNLGENRVMMTFAQPFGAEDAWGVLPDGRVAIARAATYRIEIMQDRRRAVNGPAIQFTPIRVTDDEKEAWRAARRGPNRNVTVTINGEQRTMPAPPVPEPATWPAIMPAFPSTGMFVSQEGEIIVMRSRAHTDRVPTADVFDSRGQLVGRLALPERARIVGFGARAIYLVQLDADDLQHLQKFDFPPMSGR